MVRSKDGRLIATALGCGAAVLVVTGVAGAVTNRSPGAFTRDIRTLCEAAGADLPLYAGAISQLNIMVWAAAGTLALLAAYMQPAKAAWFSLFGAFLLLLAADDALTLHESGPRRVIPEGAFYAVYAIAAVLLLVGLLRRRFDETTVAFLAGGGLLAASVIVDEAVSHQYLWEDGLKLLGAFVWLVVPLFELVQHRAPRAEHRVGDRDKRQPLHEARRS